MKNSLSKPDLIKQLKEEIENVGNFCSLYDSGNAAATQKLAHSILIILHNTDLDKSLLSRLKLNHISILSGSEPYNSKILTNYLGLLKLEHQKDKGWNYSARLNAEELKPVAQENWWQNKKVIIDSNGVSFSRSKIIKSIAETNSITLNTSGWKIKNIEGNTSIIDPIPETIRQIAFELTETFKHIDFNTESKLHYKE
ncbi:hypothetical protein [Pedobacter mucosus]|uniref:hypothetical protein n=1 Tax=Pedobacter mucosus TaxID=2895286 RepID=UPI001EE49C04|nr:hypothetical protein [Pedobacter mucosus]UKT62891.1 hypothetical protein LOK61_14090 [Pedobacter mucosus]